MLSNLRVRTLSDKHKEARRRRTDIRSLVQGEIHVGYFKASANKGAEMLRQAMYALHNEVGFDDVSGEPLDGDMIKAARKLEREFFENMWVYTRVPRTEALSSGKGKIVQGRWST